MCNIVGLAIDKRNLPHEKSSSSADEYHLEHVQTDPCLLWNLVGELQPPVKRLLLVPPANNCAKAATSWVAMHSANVRDLMPPAFNDTAATKEPFESRTTTPIPP
ncbi:hypothetical protein TB2_013722 [Malus domestica]